MNRKSVFALLGATLLGCGQQGGEPSKQVWHATEMRTIQVGGESFVEFDIGDVKFHVPEERKPASVHGDVIWWFFVWPGLRSRLLDGAPTADRLSRKIDLIVQVKPGRNGALSDSMQPAVPRDPNFLMSQWTSRLVGPYENQALGLLEYRESPASAVGVLYALPDEDYVAPDGQRPFVQCTQSPTRVLGGHRHCQAWSHGIDRLRYRYEFSDRLLSDWRQIDSAITEFLTKSLVKPN